MSRVPSVPAAMLSSIAVVIALVAAVALFTGDADPETSPVAVGAPTTASPAPTVPPTTTIGPDCPMSIRLDLGVVDPQVACLELRLATAGVFDGTPDDVFDADTDAAVRAFQERSGLLADGIAGPVTAGLLGNWVGGDLVPPDPDTCAPVGRSAVVDRDHQRAWLCADGRVTRDMPMTSAISQPDPGTYEVYAKDRHASSTIGGSFSRMTHFVAFSYGEYQGARIAFHSVPTFTNGEYVQPLDSVGDPGLHGDSSGCIRVIPDDAVAIWDWLDIGDEVIVIT